MLNTLLGTSPDVFLERFERTVCPEDLSKGCGFNFTNIDAIELLNVIVQASEIYTKEKQTFLSMQANGMKMDFSWTASAEKYESLYGWAMDARKQAFI